MKEVKQLSRNRYRSEDETIEILIRPDGRKVNDRSFSGSWEFSSKHGDMMPTKSTISIVVNGETKARDVFEEDVVSELFRLGYKVTR